MRIPKEESCFLLIDDQEKLFPFIDKNEELQKRTIRLVKGIQALGLPIIVTEQYVKGLGPTIPPIADALGNDYKPLEKMTFSCCGDQIFMNEIRQTEKKYIIVAGIESHVCVQQTVIDLISEGFKPVLIQDCVSSRNPNDKAIAVERMRQEGAIITTYESILFELLVESGTSLFKEISKIVK